MWGRCLAVPRKYMEQVVVMCAFEARPHEALSACQAIPQASPTPGEPFPVPEGKVGGWDPQEDQVPQVLLLQSSVGYWPLLKNPRVGRPRTPLRGGGDGKESGNPIWTLGKRSDDS